jgi:hypothetical protein
VEGTEGECYTPRSRGTVVAGLTIGLTLVMGFLTSIELHDIVISSRGTRWPTRRGASVICKLTTCRTHSFKKETTSFLFSFVEGGMIMRNKFGKPHAGDSDRRAFLQASVAVVTSAAIGGSATR